MNEPGEPGVTRAGWRPDLRDFAAQWKAKFKTGAREPRFWILLLALVAYSVYWSNLTIARFTALRAYVFDLGVYNQFSWEVVHGPYTVTQIWQTFSTQGITYVVFPLALPGSYPFLLATQSVVLALCAIPIFGIAERLLADRTSALLLALGYLLFFPVAGLNWFDVHTETFFIPLFLFGYYAHLTGHPRIAYLLIGLSGLARFPFATYPALFGLLRLAERRWKWLPLGADPSPRYPARYDLLLAAASLGVLLVSGLYFLTNQNSVSSFLHTAGVASAPDLDARVLTLVLLALPFFVLPALSARWVLFLVPGAALILASPESYYAYPAVFFTQYTAAFVPFLYLGFLDALTMVFPRPAASRSDAPNVARAGSFLHRRRRQTVAVSFAIVLALALLYQPWGPYNPQVAVGYNLSYYTAQNQTLYDSLNREISLIPATAGNLLVQDDMPQAFPRPLGNNGTILIPGQTMAYNFTYFYRNAWAPAHIDYVLVDPYSDTFLHAGTYPYNISMAQAVQRLYNSGEFGLMAEANGLLLFGRGYAGAIEYYVPQNLSFPVSTLFVTGAGSITSQGTILAENVTNGTTDWFGPYVFLQPGVYNVTYQLRVSNNSPANHLKLDLLSGLNDAVVASSVLTGSSFPVPGRWTNITVQEYLDSVYPWINLPADGVVWDGQLELAHIWVREVQPPSVRHVVGFTPEDQAVYRLVALVPPTSELLVQPDLSAFLPGRVYELSTSFPAASSSWPPFVLGDPYRSGYDLNAGGATESLSSLAATALATRGYHVLGMLDGVFLLTNDPSRPLVAYGGLNGTYNASSLFVTNSAFRVGTQVVATDFTSQGTVWYGPYGFLQPGRYALTYELRVSNNSAANFLKLDVLAGPLATELNSTRLTGAEFPVVDAWTNITTFFTARAFYEQSNFPANDVDWTGTIQLASITLTQLAPG